MSAPMKIMKGGWSIDIICGLHAASSIVSEVRNGSRDEKELVRAEALIEEVAQLVLEQVRNETGGAS